METALLPNLGLEGEVPLGPGTGGKFPGLGRRRRQGREDGRKKEEG